MEEEGDISWFTDKEKDKVSYDACVFSTITAGVFLGSIAGGIGAPVVGAAGLVYGLVVCPSLQKPIKKKLFSRYERLNPQEITALLGAIKTLNLPYNKKNQLLLLGLIRREAVKNADSYKKYLV